MCNILLCRVEELLIFSAFSWLSVTCVKYSVVAAELENEEQVT